MAKILKKNLNALNLDFFSRLKMKYKLFIGFILIIIFFGSASLVIEPRVISYNMENEMNDRINDVLNVTSNAFEDTKRQILGYADLIASNARIREETMQLSQDKNQDRIIQLINTVSLQLPGSRVNGFTLPGSLGSEFSLALEVVPRQGLLKNGETIKVTAPAHYQYVNKNFIISMQKLILKKLFNRNSSLSAVEIQENKGMLAIAAASSIQSIEPDLTQSGDFTYSGFIVISCPLDNNFVTALKGKINEKMHITIYKLKSTHSGAQSIASTVTGASDDPVIGKKLSSSIVSKIIRASDNQEIYLSNANIAKTPFRLGYKVLKGESGPIGLLEVAIPTEKIINATNKTKQQIYLISIMAMVLALGVIWAITRSVNEPLRRLIFGTEMLAKGDFSQRIQISSRDELGYLAEKFNWMTENIERQQKELLQYQDELVKKEKLAALGNFTSTIIHDLNNPLAAISWHAELLNKDLTPEEKNECAQFITDEINRLKEMTYEVLEYARGTLKPNKKPHLLSPLLEEIALLLNKSFRYDNIEIVLEQNFNGEIDIDAAKLKRAIYNLAINARDAMPSGGKLIIRTNCDAKSVKITISDTGRGIPKEVLGNLFQPFFTHGKENGRGLGLSICQKIIEIHEGKITVESNEGQGTTFTINLPLITTSKNSIAS